MKNKSWKKRIVALALAGGAVLGAGTFENANAQGRRGRGPVESTGNIDRNRNGIDDRYEVNGQVDINRNRIPDNEEGYYRGRRNRDDWYGDDRYYENRDRYGDRGGWYNRDRGYNNSADFQQGYRDGLNRGREDAQTNRAKTPNNSSHYRNGSSSYRAGFERGFYEAYQQYRNRRW